ncbi:hypothetical protein [Nitrosopumilus ureiphilus]|uniref:Uncharacterized protein n=1 Tax=Nitrosopumilus ureiphilus TaxID=1470067 RepID=A0A7D5M6F0_9ARCH|nr:hypothetical protein [Nitrosopumilus ureiphilus]QLH07111.1 hypothetical protein C5F50_08525 [Nitrosopumilus ureiphilus]
MKSQISQYCVLFAIVSVIILQPAYAQENYPSKTTELQNNNNGTQLCFTDVSEAVNFVKDSTDIIDNSIKIAKDLEQCKEEFAKTKSSNDPSDISSSVGRAGSSFSDIGGSAAAILGLTSIVVALGLSGVAMSKSNKKGDGSHVPDEDKKPDDATDSLSAETRIEKITEEIGELNEKIRLEYMKRFKDGERYGYRKGYRDGARDRNEKRYRNRERFGRNNFRMQGEDEF